MPALLKPLVMSMSTPTSAWVAVEWDPLSPTAARTTSVLLAPEEIEMETVSAPAAHLPWFEQPKLL